MVSPSYNFKIAAGLNNAAGLVNVETLVDADGRTFNPPVLTNDYILRQTLSGGGMFDRGYQSFTWQSDLWRPQYQYLYGTLLTGTLTNNVTFQTQRTIDSGAYSVWQGKLTLPQMSDINRNYKLYAGVQWQFTRCIQIG